MLKNVSKKYSSDISRIHISALSEDFLPSLGFNFLKNFYDGIIGKFGIFGFVDLQKNEVAGFVIGTIDMRGFFKTAIFSNFFVLCSLLALRLIQKPALIKYVLQTILYPKKDEGPPAELVIIAVSDKYRGKGIGKKLVKALEIEMRKRKIKEYKLTVTQRNKGANAFYKSLDFYKFGEFNLYNKDWNVLVKKLK